MNKLYIGCGGWAYADFGDMPGTKLKNYSKLFNFVEANSTFYQIPDLKICERWRNSVPNDFAFAVKCNRELSHIRLLKPNNISYKIFNRMIEICSILKAIALVIQTPESFLRKKQNLNNAKSFFQKIETPIPLVWEVRGLKKYPDSYSELLNIISEFNITNAIDLSKEEPIVPKNFVYSRIFGHGKQNMWQFDDEEIKVLHNKVETIRKKSDVVLSFHTMRMERDSARYQEFDQNQNLIQATNSVGLDSLMCIIKEYNKFPLTKNDLLEAHGWKIVDISIDSRIRASRVLEKLPNMIYKNFNSIESELNKIFIKNNQKNLDQFI